MPNLARLPTRAGDELVHVVVETPRGARAKLTFDPELKTFVLSKALMLGLSYPYDWGFIPSTRAEDGDPLDAMVIHDAATTPGLVLRCKLIGVLQTMQKTKHDRIRNDRRHRRSGKLAPRAGAARHSRVAARAQARAGKILRRDRRAGGQDVEVSRLAGTGTGEKTGPALRKGFQEKELGYYRRRIRQIANVGLRTQTPHLKLSFNAQGRTAGGQ